MEIFQTIWTALSTPNPTLIQICGMLLVFIEITVTMLFFTTVLNLNSTKHQKLKYILLISVLSIVSNNFVPKPLGPILHIFITPIIIKFFFKTTILKAIVSEFLPLIIIVLFETVVAKLFNLFGITYEQSLLIPIYRLSVPIIIYLCIYILYKICKYFNINISILENLTKKDKILLIITFITALTTIAIQFYLVNFYNDTVPIYITFLSILILTIYFFLSLITLSRTTRLQIINQDLEETKLYNNTLQILHDNMRAFKHDFANIVQAIGRIYRY